MADEQDKLLEQIQAQQKQIEAMQQQMEAVQKDTMYALSRRLERSGRSQSAQTHQDNTGRLPELDLSGLPDPSYDQNAYNRALQDRIKKHQEDLMKAAQEQAARARASEDDGGPSAEERASALWEDFQERHPKYAKSKALVGTAASQVLERARMRGVDPDTFMYGHTTMFFDEVAKQVDKSLKEAGYAPAESGGGEGGEEVGEEGFGPSDLNDVSYDDYMGMRTKGIFGGSPADSGGGSKKGGGSGKKGKAQKEPTAEEAFANEMAEIQKKGGYL